jgi:hypothetical protein
MTHTANAGEKAWKAFQAALLHIPSVKEKAVRAEVMTLHIADSSLLEYPAGLCRMEC